MNILMVVHQFLPRHLAGTEVYTYRLAQALRARGHDIRLFFTEIRPDRKQYELSRGEYDDIPSFEAVHNRDFGSFRRTYRDPDMERLFHTVLDESRPDLVHLQHLHLHSIGYVGIARKRGLPVVFTLHEYMLLCLNHGLLLRPGPELCDGPEPEACARCAATAYPQWSEPADGTSIARRTAARLRALVRGSARDGGDPLCRAEVELRTRDTRSELEGVDLFVAPSRFLRDRFVEAGMVRSDRVVLSDYGFFVQPFRGMRRSRAPMLRVGYVGTISEYKGVHLIVEAMRGISGPGIECRIYGDLAVFPDYARFLRESGIPPAVRYMGRLENEKLPEALADLDLLIVPSLWFENSPLTIHEAFLAGIPVVTSDRGGMAELVEDGVSGLHFRLGDAADLRRQILRVLHEPGLLERLRAGIPEVKTIEEDAATMEERYRALLEARSRPV